MNIILDLAVVLILVLMVTIGYRRGFVKSLMGLVSGILALVIAFMFAPTLAKVIDTNIIQPMVVDAVQDKITSAVPEDQGEDNDLLSFLENAPEELKGFLTSIGVDVSGIEEYFPQEHTDDDADLLEDVSKSLGAGVSNLISTVIAFILIYVASLLILKIVTVMLDGVFRLPILKIPNQLLGAAIGLVTGLITCFAVCSVIDMALPYMAASENSLFSNITADKTFLFRFFCGFDGVSQLLQTVLK